jgi:hypothetical protein
MLYSGKCDDNYFVAFIIIKINSLPLSIRRSAALLTFFSLNLLRTAEHSHSKCKQFEAIQST